MKVSLNWLKDYVPINISTDQLVHKLTMAGIEVERVIPTARDCVLELEVTPNRPDCLSLLGVARETAAVLHLRRTLPRLGKIYRPKMSCTVEIEDPLACTRYIGTLIEDLSIQKAPEAIRTRIGSLGMRPVNNVVDITNFCLMETGQPLHAFDYDKLIGGKIVVRRALEGERLVTIDGVERALDPTVLVIADAKRPVAIAGVMGGKETEVTETTKRILLESAHFDPLLTRRVSRKLGLHSDSSYRFERGVDGGMVEAGADRAVFLILKNAGGRVTQRRDWTSAKTRGVSRAIGVSTDQLNNFLGTSETAAVYKRIFRGLDFKITEPRAGQFRITPPSFRGDITRVADLVEEAARMLGYDKLPLSFPAVKASALGLDSRRRVRRRVRETLISQGMDEVITYTMINRKALEFSGQGEVPVLAIVNPLSQDQEVMRPSMLPGLLALVRSNKNRGQNDVKFFEVGKIYDIHGEREVLGMIMAGQRGADWREDQRREVDFYDIKGAIGEALGNLGVDKDAFRTPASGALFFEPGHAAEVRVKGERLGEVGKVSGDVLRQWDIKQKKVFFAQIDMGKIYARGWQVAKYKPLSEFPSVSRDISLAVDRRVIAQDLIDAIQATARADKQVVLEGVEFLELYEGEKISPDQRGLVFSLTYQSRFSRTLTDEEVAQAHTQVCAVLQKKFDVIFR